ncbi:hypothetical protein OQJ65_17130 [Vibrio sp. Sgm 22]|uniref:hypothetical protein n=1 Tax=unclassified Vibrio TaxID=2614977 RepID=UPI002248FD56|nr:MULTISPECIES: hypothetical protein [unclassified Vibrio]MCX2760059.1 hypothetical protein [Vibrio sp. 14G-20]MCX2777047.1 hypothetical protein [Vibrio sp. Sgm 22]
MFTTPKESYTDFIKASLVLFTSTSILIALFLLFADSRDGRVLVSFFALFAMPFMAGRGMSESLSTFAYYWMPIFGALALAFINGTNAVYVFSFGGKWGTAEGFGNFACVYSVALITITGLVIAKANKELIIEKIGKTNALFAAVGSFVVLAISTIVYMQTPLLVALALPFVSSKRSLLVVPSYFVLTVFFLDGFNQKSFELMVGGAVMFAVLTLLPLAYSKCKAKLG